MSRLCICSKKALAIVPVVFLAAVNRVLVKNLRRMQVDKTMPLACLNYQHGTLKLVGQHEELLVVRHEGAPQAARVERIDTLDLGFPQGLTDALPTGWPQLP